MSNELLNFKFTLSSKQWSKHPQFSIWIDSHRFVSSELPNQEIHTFEFSHEVTEGNHDLKIRLENKDKEDTQIVNGEIVNDMLLNIEDIMIDNVSLGNLLWSGEYHLDKPQQYNGRTITKLDNCINLGWNGAYVLNFSSPFYIWLLEKI